MKLFVKPKSKRTALWIGAFVALSIAIYFPVYLGVIHSDAYNSATNFIKQNQTVNRLIGGNLSCNLKLFSGYSIKHTFGSGRAKFNIYVTSQRDKGKVSIGLEKSRGDWRIIRAELHTSKNSNVITLK